MKIKTGFIILAFISIITLQITRAEAQTENKPITIYDETFEVPGSRPLDKPLNGAERSFTLTKKSTVSLSVESNEEKPALNFYLFDDHNYSIYKESGSFAYLTYIDSFSRKDTLGFKASADLPVGKYHFLIRWIDGHYIFVKRPDVDLKLIVQEHEPKPKGFWSNLFSGNK